MKVFSLSQNCANIIGACNNYGNNRPVSVTKSVPNYVKNPNNYSLKKVYCISSLSFLACLTAFYAATAYICSQSKEVGSSLLKVI